MTVAELDKVHVLFNERKERGGKSEKCKQLASSDLSLQLHFNKAEKKWENSQADSEMNHSFCLKCKQLFEWDLKTIVLYQFMSLSRLCHQQLTQNDVMFHL